MKCNRCTNGNDNLRKPCEVTKQGGRSYYTKPNKSLKVYCNASGYIEYHLYGWEKCRMPAQSRKIYQLSVCVLDLGVWAYGILIEAKSLGSRYERCVGTVARLGIFRI
jgi:hypothetical protein